jgi:tetratricopeptide (TPR) repeat protein
MQRLRPAVVLCLLLSLLAGMSCGAAWARKRDTGEDKKALSEAARQVRKGSYAPGAMDFWKHKLAKAQAQRRWPLVALCHSSIGLIHYHEGRLDPAVESLEKAVAAHRRTKNTKGLVRDLFWTALVFKRAGSFDAAFGALDEMLPLAAKQGDDLYEVRGRVLRADLLRARGRINDAIRELEAVLAIAEQSGDERMRAAAYADLGRIYSMQGNLDRAGDYLNRALAHADPQGGGPSSKGAIQLSLGDLDVQRNAYPAAMARYRKALEIYRQKGKAVGEMKAGMKVGRMYARQGDVAQAMDYYQEARALAEKNGTRGMIAKIAKNMGKLHRDQAQWPQALEKVETAIAHFEAIGIPMELQDCYFMKGQALEALKDIDAAMVWYGKSVALLESLRQGMTMSEEDSDRWLEKRGDAYRDLIRLLMQAGRTREAMEVIERSRMKQMRDQFDALRPELQDEEEQAAVQKETELREQLEAARSELALEQEKREAEQDNTRIAKLEASLEEKKRAYFEHIGDLREDHPDLASLLAIQPDSLVDLQELLPPTVVILQYLILEQELYIFVVSADNLAYRVVDVDRESVEGSIDYLRSVTMNPRIAGQLGPLEPGTLMPQTPSARAMYTAVVKPFKAVSSRLYELLLAPVAEDIAAFDVVGIIPNGKLHLLPFTVLGRELEASDGARRMRFFLEEKSVFYLNSQSILKFAREKAGRIAADGRLVAFGNPDRSLQFAEEEIRMIRGAFDQTTAYLGEEASESRLKEEIEGFSILHLATHGKMAGRIRESYILLAPSGDDGEDGKLFLREIWGLPLSGFQLVTLSACETAKGKEASGDIMVSLETAFLRAGTPAIMATLWEVDDRATGVMMDRFYRQLVAQGKSRALRSAQLALLQEDAYAFPFYWAPYILVGDWR